LSRRASSGVGGLYLHQILPRRHLTKETLDVVKLGTGMLSVLASLVLGLLIATAKTSHDQTDAAIRSYAAELALLNETLRDHGGVAAVPRDLLRDYTRQFLQQVWPCDGTRQAMDDDVTTRVLPERVRESIRALKPVDRMQGGPRDEAVGINMNLLRQRWALIEQQGPNVQRVVLMILVSWITVIFASFECAAQRYRAGGVPDLLAGDWRIDFPDLGDGSADGWLMQISSWPIENVLAHMDW
jgi:hypothetical protein